MPWPVVLIFVLVILPPVLTFSERRYRVLPQDLTLPFTILEAIIVTVFVIETFRRKRASQNATIALFCGSGLVMNVIGLTFLIGKMLDPQGLDGRRLLVSAIYLWLSNMLFFALAYWAMDGGGPDGRAENEHPRDLIFPEMQTNPDQPFLPKFFDYIYVAFSTSTAFSATDTLTGSSRIRALLVVQAAISLATIAIVAARAVNIFPSG